MDGQGMGDHGADGHGGHDVGRADGHGYDDPGPGYVAGALVGGLVSGVLGALVMCCCLLWAPLGGLLGAWIAARRAWWFGPQEGLVAGACAGAVAWLVEVGLSLPLAVVMPKLFKANPQLLAGLPPAMQQMYTQEPNLAGLAVVHGLALIVWLALAGGTGALAGQTFLRKDAR